MPTPDERIRLEIIGKGKELYGDDDAKIEAFYRGAIEVLSNFHYIINQKVYGPNSDVYYPHLSFPYSAISAPSELEGKEVAIFIREIK